MAQRLRRSDCSGPGISRRRRGRGFEYLDADGERVTDREVLDRIEELVIPPAWEDVWICPYPGGHIQATGSDDRGRKQYLYHQRWRARRDAEKFDDMVRFAHALPDLRGRVDDDLDGDELTHARVLACAVRLLDRGFFRIGSEEYTDSFGLATMQKSHVTLGGEY
jgi:DNA topoisomerase I